jgi:radical SAM superfamily enzyme YgiQ (UPF0313 family)
MNILLVYPEVPNTFWSLKTALKFVSKKALLPPVGLLTVASMLPESFEKKLIDMNVSKLRDRHIKWADYVFISAMVVQKKSAKAIVKRCSKLNTKVVAGGPLFTSFPDLVPDADYLVLNEAEITLPQFLNDLKDKSPKKVYKTNQKAQMQKSPIPAWNLVKMKKYAMMGLQYSRGCPYNCDFCDITALLGRKIRTKTTEKIINELENLYDNKWRGNIFFVDDNFIGKRKQLKEQLLPAIIEWMKYKKYPFTFNTQVSIDLVDDEQLMALMTKAGFNCVFIGVETPDDETLYQCSKNQNTGRDIVAAVKKIQRFGMQVQAGFIVGFDNDKPNVFDKLINLVQESGIITAMVGLLNAPRGTKLYQKLKQENRLVKLPTGDNMDCSINFIPKMDINELVKGYQKVVETLYSQKYYCKRIKTFLKNYNFPDKRKMKFKLSNIKAFFVSTWKIGILEKGKIHYWMLIIWALTKPKKFHLAVRFSIYGYHFRKMLKNLRPQLEKVTSGTNVQPDTEKNYNTFDTFQ